jgi:hypothetical protein
MRYFKSFRTLLNATLGGVVAFIAGCTTPPLPELEPSPISRMPDSKGTVLASKAPSTSDQVLGKVSIATTPLAYRKDAAHHLYGQNAHRIFKGKMPPLLYAIGVLQIEVGSKGQVTGTHWMRSPNQAPEVVAEIERTVRLAAPFPVPALMGRVIYTDTWLWHRSGHFQLDTLTEGQL